MGKTLSKRYKILDKVGEGGMSLVYKAKDMLLGRLVAVKVLRAEYAGDREFVERFRREAQSAASLSHANVVNIYDVGQEDGTDYIVMEYVEGRNLKDIIRNQKTIPIPIAVDIARQVAMALDHAHRHQLVHRDIKPHNILITEDNQVKVTDFGIALAASYSQLTQAGFVVGTAHYFSPEQAKGGMATAQSDLYSLGVVLYEMLTGRLPFTGDTPVAIALKHVQEPIRPPRMLNPKISSELNKVVLKALAKEPDKRYQTAAEMASDLQKIAANFGRAYNKSERSLEPDETRVIPAVEGKDERTMIRRLEREEETTTRQQRTMKKRRKRRGLYLFLFLLVFLGLIMWAASKLPELIFPEEVIVPNVVGKTQSEARNILEERGLKLAVDREIYSDEVPAGQVVSQEPEANRRVKMYRTIFVEVSKGPRLIEVPSVVGLSARDARLRITQAGLSVGKETAVLSPDVPLEHVVSQTPEAGSYLKEGLPVDLVISREQVVEETVVLPNLRNIPLEEAKSRLLELSLTLGNVWADTSYSVPKGYIISQNPSPGTQLAPGDSVDFVYSQGPPGSSPSSEGSSSSQTGDESQEQNSSNGFEEQGGTDDGAKDGGDNTEPSQQQEPSEGNADSAEMGTGEGVIQDTASQSTIWKQADVRVSIPSGPAQQVVLIVIDELGAREVYRGTHEGGNVITRRIVGRGDDARIQVYIDNTLVAEQSFPD